MENQTTNRLFFAASKGYKQNGKNYRIRVELRLDDQCKNGHEDFSVTADGYEVKDGREVWQYGGCCHDEVLKHFPDLADFVTLHLCDCTGAPTYAVENGFYHIQHGNKKAVEDMLYCCTADEIAEAMSQADKDKLFFKMWLEAKQIPARWQQAASTAIKKLEAMQRGSLEGCKFASQATKRQYTPPTDEEKAEFAARIKSGYYTPEQCKARRIAKIDELISENLDYYDRKIQEAKDDKQIKGAALQVLKAMAGENVEDFKRLKDGFLVYRHNDTICVMYDANKISTDEKTEFCTRLEADKICTGLKIDSKKRNY